MVAPLFSHLFSFPCWSFFNKETFQRIEFLFLGRILRHCSRNLVKARRLTLQAFTITSLPFSWVLQAKAAMVVILINLIFPFVLPVRKTLHKQFLPNLNFVERTAWLILSLETLMTKLWISFVISLLAALLYLKSQISIFVTKCFSIPKPCFSENFY